MESADASALSALPVIDYNKQALFVLHDFAGDDWDVLSADTSRKIVGATAIKQQLEKQIVSVLSR